MCEFSAYVAFKKATNGQTQYKTRTEVNTAIFNSDIQLSVYFFSCFISVCPFVALLKATYAEKSHIVFVLSTLQSVHF